MLLNNHIKCKYFNHPSYKAELSDCIKNEAQLLAAYKKCI